MPNTPFLQQTPSIRCTLTSYVSDFVDKNNDSGFLAHVVSYVEKTENIYKLNKIAKTLY